MTLLYMMPVYSFMSIILHHQDEPYTHPPINKEEVTRL